MRRLNDYYKPMDLSSESWRRGVAARYEPGQAEGKVVSAKIPHPPCGGAAAKALRHVPAKLSGKGFEVSVERERHKIPPAPL